MSKADSSCVAQLCDVTSGRVHRLEPNLVCLVGRNPRADLPLEDVQCSRSQFQIVANDRGVCFLEPLSTTSPTFCDGQIVTGRTELVRSARIRAGQSEFWFATSDAERDQMLPAQMPTVIGGPLVDRHHLAPAGIPVVGDCIIGRDPAQAQIHLPHVQVSRAHARIRRHNDGAILSDLGSSNGTFVNGGRLTLPLRIKDGDSIGIGPYELRYSGGHLLSNTRENNLQLVADRLRRSVAGVGAREPLAILDDVSLVIRPREFICLLGPAGCGKSTLLSALSARAPADQGAVLLNDVDLYEHFELLKHDLAMTPQHDTLHASLTVEQAVHYTARLRLPRDTAAEEIDRAVSQTISTVGLTPQRRTAIKHLSGGQRKRTSVALEILAKPSLLFIDEATSGLDEQSDREMMCLFRQLADQGKTVICVTHNLANVERTCHLVAILAAGGKLVFVGAPNEALEYFGVARLGDIYEQLASRPADDWKRDFESSACHQIYVASRLVGRNHLAASLRPTPERARGERLGSMRHQWPILTARYIRLLLADRGAVLLTLCQCLIVSCLVALVFGDITQTGQIDPRAKLIVEASYASSLLFVAAISCLWFGCNNSVKEIVKERTIFVKERQINLNLPAYYASKFCPLAVMAIVQATVFYSVVSCFCAIPGEAIMQAAIFCGMAVVGVAMGLAISAVARSEEFAMAMVPITLIPQIVLSDRLRSLDGAAKVVAQLFVSSYWGYGALRETLPAALHPFLDAAPLDAIGAWTVLAAHVAVLVVASLIALNRSSGRQRSVIQRFAAIIGRIRDRFIAAGK